ncbi:MAG TPA: TIGR02266 family protein, partial [Nitrospiraceae bacterium]|nr:TIGR02266 family protein [Nitrospiraceae bacterium]
MRLQVITTVAHKGKALELDCEGETITVRGLKGEKLGTVTWAAIIEQARPTQEQERVPETRIQPRLSLVLKVKYSTSGGKCVESRAGGIGGGGLFIESTAPLAVGTDLELEFALPGSASDWMAAKGTVAWVCPKSDQYTFSPGMGIRFTDISAEARAQVLAFVNAMKRSG